MKRGGTKEPYVRQADGTMKAALATATAIELEGAESLNRLYDRLALVPWKAPAP